MTTMINGQAESSSRGLRGAEPLLLQQSVPPGLVRRINSSDVFVTRLTQLETDRFEVGVRWPGTHSFYRPAASNLHDPLLFLESVREAGVLIAHAGYQIPMAFKFLTRDKRFRVESLEGLRTNGSDPVDVTLVVSAREIQRRAKSFAGMLFEAECYREGVRIGTAAYRWSCVSAAGYTRLRGRYRDAVPEVPAGASPVHHDLVGRCAPIDVMLADTDGENTWLLRVDPEHGVVYDHPMDHVPGNAIIEAGRQAALLASGQPDGLPSGGHLDFHRYIEFDQPCTVTAEPVAGTSTVRLAFDQSGARMADGALDVRVP
ncbi:ScbA/BarX family gamma-butyrolactone biosynthesis protein [Actinophytocola sediminis]